jgi:hypothetical protein
MPNEMRCGSFVVTLGIVCTVTCFGARARAGTFDPSGNFSFDPTAVVVQTFDDVAPQDQMTIVRAGDAVQGATYIDVNVTNGNPVSFPIVLPAKDASYVARMFARTNRVVATINVNYPNDNGSPSFGAHFNPSGTVTSDGWYEVVTNPFSVQGSRNPTASLTINANFADVDALEIVPSGTFVNFAQCSPPVDAACGAHQYCETGWCRDGNNGVPPLPPPDERDDVLAYFRNRLSIFFGGAYSRANYLPNALATIDSLHAAPDAWTFWNGIVTAIHRLHDWHTTLGGPVNLAGQGLIPACFVEGDADLSHAIVPKDPNYFDVLVSHIGPASTILKPGDRLVAVNGMHPIAFVESLDSLDWGMWRADDPDTHAEAVERMIPVIRRFATNITYIHCDPVLMTCGAPVTIAVTDLPFDDGTALYPYCDHRPLYHLGANGPDPVAHNSYNGPFYGVAVESQTDEDIYNMVWNDVYIDGTSANPYAPAYDAIQANAKAVILDHRLGNGGDVEGAQYLTSIFRPEATIASWAGFNQTLGEFDSYTTSFGLSLYQVSLPTGAYEVGSSTANTKLPTALLIARDGSASDWFPLGMQGGSPNVRVFGRHTAGAFSSYFVFDYFSNFTWRIASGDLINPDGTTHLGNGVRPDEEIVPLQSDLLAGVDTAYARALDWVRTCTVCRQ